MDIKIEYLIDALVEACFCAILSYESKKKSAAIDTLVLFYNNVHLDKLLK